MNSPLTSTSSTRALLRGAFFALGLTTLHHAYGAFRYGTPWRNHVAFFALGVGAVTLAASSVHRRRRGTVLSAIAGWTLALVTLAVPVAGIGGFEGLYNHLLKDVLYFAGVPHSLWLRLFPPPKYELPNDILFELSGVLQAAAGAFAASSLFRFVRSLRGSRGERVEAGSMVIPRDITTLQGARIRIPDPKQLLHLQFRRFAGCPVCDLHLQSFVRRHEEIAASGIREVVFFHSSEDELRVHASHLPFAVVADPQKRVYAAFGVESGYRAMLDPGAWIPILRAVVRSLVRVLRGQARAPSLNPSGGRYGLPADFLLDGDGRVLAAHYGTHAYDQWSVDDLLERVREAAPSATRGTTDPATSPAPDPR